MKDAENTCVSEHTELPFHLRTELTGYTWTRNLAGRSGAFIYRLEPRRERQDLFLKFGDSEVARDITEEVARMRWLSGRIPVPEVRFFTGDDDRAWLLMTAVPGRSASEILAAEPGAGPAVVDAIAAFMRRMHNQPVAVCPFLLDHTVRLKHARARMEAGLVDVEDFDDERRGLSAGQVWEMLLSHYPTQCDQVVCHGDFTLENILILDGQVTGVIDLGRCGVADRYQDVAVLWNSLGDSSLQERLLRGYGISNLDHRKLQFHLLLDEFF